MEIITAIAQELKIKKEQVENTLKLLEEGNSVPFIARYRKERTQGLDEEQIRIINEQYEYQVNLKKRKEDVLRLIQTQGKLNDEIVKNVNACTKLSQVEDIYRPYKQKKKTRASVAIQNGLLPLAEKILSQPRFFDEKDILPFVKEEIKSIEEALQGAKDIIAEKVSEDVKVRNKIHDSMMQYGRIKTVAKKNHGDEACVYKMYYAYEEKLETLAPHRIMAINRAEKEKVLNVSIEINEDYIYTWVKKCFIRYANNVCTPIIEEAIQDGLNRLAYPSIENMVRAQISEKAHESSIDIFSMNLEKLLLQAPMKNKVILGFDPAFRTGCKLAVIDASGKKLCVDVIYPHKPNAKVKEAEMNAEADKQKKDKIEALNQADSTIYQTEKTLNELGDKVSADDKSQIESAIAKLKEVKDKESATAEEIKAAMDEVMNKFHKISEQMYQQAQAQQQANAGQEQAGPQDDNVVDADFTEVNDEK